MTAGIARSAGSAIAHHENAALGCLDGGTVILLKVEWDQASGVLWSGMTDKACSWLSAMQDVGPHDGGATAKKDF